MKYFQPVLNEILQFLEQEHYKMKNRDLDASRWFLKHEDTANIPRQMNGFDCGVFVIKYAQYLVKEALTKESFDQQDLALFRRRLIWEISNRTIMWS